ncbi:MAG: hypothetical protein MUF20_08285 [Methylotetracoccus sp.]|nr:hypothetical protein [Methylotetracoccus sp.]
MKPWVILLAGWVTAAAQAAGDDDFYENQCHDAAAWSKFDDLLRRFPNDHLVIRAYATRLGICRLIDEKKISLETGIQVFDIERQRAVMERSMEEAQRNDKKRVPGTADPIG